MSKLTISLSPHVHSGDSVGRNMYGVILALVPALIASLWFFGIGSAVVLATSVVAARKGSDGLALGNVLGSNVFNAVFVLGACNLIAPMQITGVNMLDWSVLVGSCVLLWIVSFSGRRLTRGEGTLLLTAYVAYMTYTLLH